MQHPAAPESPLRRWLSTLPVLLLLLATVLHWSASELSGSMIRAGEAIWPGYAVELRRDRPRPEPPAAAASQTGPAANDDLIGDLLGEDAAAPAAQGQADEALIGDLLGEAAPAPPQQEGAADDDLIGDLLGEPAAPATDKAAEAAALDQTLYQEDLAAWESAQAQRSAGLLAWRTLDTGLGEIAVQGGEWIKHLLVLLVLFCGATATATREHIALRPISTVLDDRVSQGTQLFANLLVVFSLLTLARANAGSGVELANPELPLLWATAFGLMASINLVLLARPSPRLKAGGRWQDALLTGPLYAGMAILSSGWFLILEGYSAGLGVYLQKLTEHAELYIFVGLYVWTGMLLKRTQVAHLAFDVLRPWKLPPELLAALVVLMAAVPTAYSGASGIFVIAVGGLIYTELTVAGARPQLALAATAMSGSLGVVLRPCLLVVIVAYLNPPTTDVLYGWGRWVFLLTASLFAIAVVLTRRNPLTVASPAVAIPGSLRALRPLLPYAVAFAAVLLGAKVLLGSTLDEHTAPVLLPIALLAMLGLEGLAPVARPPAGRHRVLFGAVGPGSGPAARPPSPPPPRPPATSAPWSC